MRVSKRAVRQAEDLGLDEISNDLETLLITWGKQSAIITHEEGNRRYEDYILDIEEDLILNIDLLWLDERD